MKILFGFVNQTKSSLVLYADKPTQDEFKCTYLALFDGTDNRHLLKYLGCKNLSDGLMIYACLIQRGGRELESARSSQKTVSKAS